MNAPSDLRMTRIPLNHGAGHMPALGFGTLIPDAALTITATRDALEAGFRHFDCAERYGNEHEVGKALQAGLAGGGVAREDIFVTTKLWNSNHRPERVEPAFEASLDRLGLKYLDLYLIHTPFALRLPPFLKCFSTIASERLSSEPPALRSIHEAALSPGRNPSPQSSLPCF
jgi:aldehyde reductase